MPLLGKLRQKQQQLLEEEKVEMEKLIDKKKMLDEARSDGFKAGIEWADEADLKHTDHIQEHVTSQHRHALTLASTSPESIRTLFLDGWIAGCVEQLKQRGLQPDPWLTASNDQQETQFPCN